MTITILRKRWKVRFVTRLGKDIDGDCDDPVVPNRTIRVLLSLRGRDLLETLIHEFTHGADHSKKEEWVTEFSRDLAIFLTRMGYKRDE